MHAGMQIYQYMHVLYMYENQGSASYCTHARGGVQAPMSNEQMKHAAAGQLPVSQSTDPSLDSDSIIVSSSLPIYGSALTQKIDMYIELLIHVNVACSNIVCMCLLCKAA